jgi:PQQ-dependent catabolism-associated CXXCW motif protein
MNRIAIVVAAAALLAGCDSGTSSKPASGGRAANQLAAASTVAPGAAPASAAPAGGMGLPPLPGTDVASNAPPPNAALQSSTEATPAGDTATPDGTGATQDSGQVRAGGGDTTASVAPVPTGTNYANEAADFGVAPQSTLKSNVGTQTPTSIPGGRTMTTANLAKALHDGLPLMLIDAWDDSQGGSHATLPGATEIPFAGRPGSFADATQGQLEAALQRLTHGDRTQTLVFFCQGAVCWEAYNAALRAMHAGYDDVVWYRGGLPAWTQSGGQLKVPGQG